MKNDVLCISKYDLLFVFLKYIFQSPATLLDWRAFFPFTFKKSESNV